MISIIHFTVQETYYYKYKETATTKTFTGDASIQTLCNRVWVGKGTRDWNKVTCKSCMKGRTLFNENAPPPKVTDVRTSFAVVNHE